MQWKGSYHCIVTDGILALKKDRNIRAFGFKKREEDFIDMQYYLSAYEIDRELMQLSCAEYTLLNKGHNCIMWNVYWYKE